MSADPYSDRVRDLFARPSHAGRLDGGVEAYVEDQGVRILLTAACQDGRIVECRFMAWGCPHLLAACEAACAGLEGRPTADLDHFSASGLMQTLAVPVEKRVRILVIEDVIRSLGAAIREASGTNQ